ncbi:MAG: hypothetical protein K9K39_07375 [Desulfohalobiaceae bacterium]|nr:hypothetical protein [Desulfohalobiaceae bacterium]
MSDSKLPQALVDYLRIPDDQDTKDRVESLRQEALGLIRPIVWHRDITTEEFHNLFSPWSQESESITSLLCGAERIRLLAASLGSALENESRVRQAKGNVFEGYILDRIGSYLVEREMRRLDRQTSRQALSRDQICGRRYSPGYGDFPLEAQTAFHRLLRPVIPEISISPGLMLYPEKTVTALKPVYPG